tara:strand:- start:317 stop:481 length:165 start_codon:yes stop_codon:yes gene_type:complete
MTKNNLFSRSRYIHLYNPKKEGIGLYDVHYINAYKKEKTKKNKLKKENDQRYAA